LRLGPQEVVVVLVEEEPLVHKDFRVLVAVEGLTYNVYF
jgi:hypothetical protein